MELEDLQHKLYADICSLVEDARNYVATTANTAIKLMYWRIGDRTSIEMSGNQGSTYGKQILSQLATILQMQFGERGFQNRNIPRMMQFSQLFPDFQIVSELATKLSCFRYVDNQNWFSKNLKFQSGTSN